MKNALMTLSASLMLGGIATAQKVTFEEYTLDNGLHVILHNDPTAPTIITSVMYHVGTKDEDPEKTGFAHFFEHLLFEGTENIQRGEWFKIVSGNGGINNANTSDDRTYYFEIFPSNNLELGLWMEAERMMHPIINQIGVDTQNEVIKEEKKNVIDNVPYGNFISQVKKNLFFTHPYRWETIGSTEHLDAAKLQDFQAFHKKFYIPNNAVLVVAGNFETNQAKKWIRQYFDPIKKGTPIVKSTFLEVPINETVHATYEDTNIQIPAIVAAYRTPSMKTRDARILEMISSLLSGGKSSKLYKKIVDDKKMALQVGAFDLSQEDYGMYILYALPLGEISPESILKEIDDEIITLQTNLISENDLQKIQNKIENEFVNKNASLEGVATSLATYYLLFGNTQLINTDIETYRTITREEIRDVAKKYLNPNQRLLLNYIPSKDKAQN
ncbi:M16 family metallopeptidase [Flavobacterium luteum]|uniref:Insulinase family protein n=1 Tax=Flavobacterium luteum TaxID=2026654 RepID=A0A7J5AEU1_9FLAO|nr:pitrilysin family protein [Flavobacterium luteum]KAB1156092.1 insulinase family protein [Flavobacterium luteum]